MQSRWAGGVSVGKVEAGGEGGVFVKDAGAESKLIGFLARRKKRRKGVCIE